MLGELKSERAIDPLIRMLDDKKAGWMAAISLGKIGIKEMVPPLIQLLGVDDVQRRRAAVWALTKIPSEKAVNPLIKSLEDRDEEVNVLAKLALEKIGTPKALDAIEGYGKGIKK